MQVKFEDFWLNSVAHHINKRNVLASLAMFTKGQAFFQNAKIHERSKYKNKYINNEENEVHRYISAI